MPYTEFHYTPTGTGVISGKEVLEQTEDAINDLGGQISGDVQTAIDTANNALNTANTASADAQNAVNTANTAYTAATNAQNTANTAQNTASNALTAAQNAQNDVDALENVVTGIDGRLTTTEGNVTNLTTRMGTAEGNITTLQNDVITAQGTATSAQNTATLARGQAYVVRYASVAVSDNSTVPYTDLNNTDNIKANDLLLDINGKIYQISSVDTANETVSVTTPLTRLAVDGDVVHKGGDETISGLKTFLKYITSNGSTVGDEYSNNAKTNLWLLGNRDTEEVSGVLFDTYRQNTAQGTGMHILGIGIKENSVRYEGCRWGWYWDNNLNGYTFDFKPTTQGTNQALKHNLGTSIDKWDTINGINPGALSLPNLSAGVDISSYITVVANANKESLYTPPANGWVCVRLSRTSGALGVLLIQGNMASGGKNIEVESGVTTADAMLPVVGGVQVSINSALADGVVSAYFYPCQGNV